MARITIGMPTYNAENHVAEAIECVLNQSFGDLDLLISDNASTDNTENICRHYMNNDNRVKYFRHQQNLGATENYNFVFRKSRSELYKWHSSNDYFTENTIEKCIDVLDKFSEVVLCYPPTKLFNQSFDDAEDYDDNMIARSDSAVNRFFHVIDNMALNNVMNGVIRSNALQKTPLIREFPYADRNMVAELALLGKIVSAEGCCFYRRMDAESATSLKSGRELLAHFNPRLKRPVPYASWRIFSAYLSSLIRSNIGTISMAKALPMLGRRMWWAKGDLWEDVGMAARYAFYDLSATISGKNVKEDDGHQ